MRHSGSKFRKLKTIVVDKYNKKNNILGDVETEKR